MDVLNTDCTFLYNIYNKHGHVETAQTVVYPQIQHYKLLAYFAKQFQNSVIIDAGTHQGISAVCLANNPTNKVHSYDFYTVNRNNFFEYVGNSLQHTPIGSQYPNIEFHNSNILSIEDDLIKSTSLIFLNVSHDGETEHAFIQKLVKANFNGIVLCDDILLNHQMINWFSSVSQKKYDITKLGHVSGTGAIVFGDFDIELVDY